MKNLQKSLGLCFALLFVLVACSRTNLMTTWKNSEYEGGYLEKVFLVMLSDNTENRKIFEGVFAKAFEKNGVNAVSSLSVIPAGEEKNKDTVKAEASKLGMNAIFVTNLISVGERVVYRPSPTGPSRASPGISMFSYDYQNIYDYAYDSGYYRRQKYLKLDSKLYETATEKLIWSVSSETIEPKSINDVIAKLSKAVMKNLKENQLIK